MISNINACCVVVDAVRTTLGPLGMDKLIFDAKGTTISNDGATIMKARGVRRSRCGEQKRDLALGDRAAATG